MSEYFSWGEWLITLVAFLYRYFKKDYWDQYRPHTLPHHGFSNEDLPVGLQNIFTVHAAWCDWVSYLAQALAANLKKRTHYCPTLLTGSLITDGLQTVIFNGNGNEAIRGLYTARNKTVNH